VEALRGQPVPAVGQIRRLAGRWEPTACVYIFCARPSARRRAVMIPRAASLLALPERTTERPHRRWPTPSGLPSAVACAPPTPSPCAAAQPAWPARRGNAPPRSPRPSAAPRGVRGERWGRRSAPPFQGVTPDDGRGFCAAAGVGSAAT
jgi:hypothetical protein